MIFSSTPNYNLDPTANWNHQEQQQGNNTEVHHHHHPRPSYIPLLPPPYRPPVHSQPPTTHHQGVRPGSMTDQARKANMPIPETFLKCPRCASLNTKFCYYNNNYSLSQPRYFCKNCRRYWTQGGSLRNVPVGGGCRKNKRSSSKGGGGGGGGSSTSTRSKSPSNSGSTPSNNSAGYSSSHHLIRNNGSHVQPSPVSFMAPLNHLSDYSIADIGANYPGLIPQVLSSPNQFNLMMGNVNRVPSSSGMEPWRFVQQQQLVQQYHHPTFFDGNSEIPLGATTTNLYDDQSGVTPRESNDHKLLNSTTAAGPDAQMDLMKLERNISSCYDGASRAQFMSRPHQYSWSGAASEDRNVNNNGNSPSAPTNAWIDLISRFNSTSSTTLHPS